MENNKNQVLIKEVWNKKSDNQSYRCRGVLVRQSPKIQIKLLPHSISLGVLQNYHNSLFNSQYKEGNDKRVVDSIFEPSLPECEFKFDYDGGSDPLFAEHLVEVIKHGR